MSRRTLFYIRKSVIRYLTQVEEYDLSEIQSIGCGGLYDTELLGDPDQGIIDWKLFLMTILQKHLILRSIKKRT